jgi:hypothetical protein
MRIDGPVAAGRLGMSLSIAWAIIGIGSVWINAVTPELGRLAAGGDWESMDRIWRTALGRGLALAVLGCCGVMVGLLFLTLWWQSLAIRFLPPLLLACTLAFSLAHVLISAIAVQLRAHRCEPFMTFSIVLGLTIVTSAALAAMRFGVAGVVVAQAFVQVFLGLGGAILLKRRLLCTLRRSRA